MCRLTDKLCLYLKVKTFKHSATGAWKRYFVNDLMTTSRLRPAKSAVSLPLAAQNRYQESQTSHSGDIFQLNDRLRYFFFLKKSLSLSVCTCYGKKAAIMF